MSYISLYRKWRSQDFNEIVGQAHIIKTLKNAIGQDRISHAYFFCGPRGTGKTSIARIFAKALNCEKGPTADPCGKCSNCTKIRDGHAPDVIEIDAASNRGIDEIRDLREKVRYAPIEGRFKVYIIDEVHMLTSEAFNALLKTLEEPPAQVVFILATTEPGKVPITIASRCQRLDFVRIPLAQVKAQLSKIGQTEEFEIEEKALDMVARSGEGSMRDSISLLDQLVSFAGKKITFDDVVTLLGCADEELLFSLADAILSGDDRNALELLRGGIDEGRSAPQIVKDLLNHFRNLMFAKVGAEDLLELTRDYQARIKEQSQKLDLNAVKLAMRALSRAELDMKWHPQARLVLEVGLLELIDGLDIGPKTARPQDLKTEEPKPLAVSSEPAVVPAAGGNGQFDKIKSHWEDILEKAKKTSLYGYLSLAEGELLGISDRGRLMIGFRKGYSFHKQQLEEEKNRETVEKIISEITGEKVRIEGIVGDVKMDTRPQVSVSTVKDIFEGEVI
jgi:DNA polymerase-3 subunit gamma/tau